MYAEYEIIMAYTVGKVALHLLVHRPSQSVQVDQSEANDIPHLGDRRDIVSLIDIFQDISLSTSDL